MTGPKVKRNKALLNAIARKDNLGDMNITEQKDTRKERDKSIWLNLNFSRFWLSKSVSSQLRSLT